MSYRSVKPALQNSTAAELLLLDGVALYCRGASAGASPPTAISVTHGIVSKNRHAIGWHLKGVRIMGKYFLAWLLGVPAIVLVIVYFIF